MASKYDDELLEGLTEEERAALEEDEETEGTEEEEIEDETAEQSTDEEEGGDDDADADSEGAGEEEGGEAEEERAPPPLLKADLPEDVEDRLKEIATSREELDTKFDDGELTTKEYRQEMAKLDRSEREIEQKQFKAQIAQEMHQQQQQQAWLDTVNDFLDANPEYREKPLLFNTLDMVVKEVASDEASANLTGRQILSKAHAQIQEQLGIGQTGQQDSGKAKKAGKRSIDAPPTLGRVPAAESNDPTKGGKWSKLDALMDDDPLAYEAELEKMSEADREAYFAAH